MTLLPLPSQSLLGETIDLELSQELQDVEIITTFFFEPYTTKNFVLELNHVYNNKQIISHYCKDWNRCKRNLKDELREKEVQESHIKVILGTLDANYNTITVTQENYDRRFAENEEYQEQTNNKDSTTAISKKEDAKKTHTINKYSQGIPLIESILINNIPYFTQTNEDGEGKKVPVFYKKYELADIDLIPPGRTEYLSKEYSFASFEEVQYFIDLAKNETLDSLFNRVKTNLKKFIDIDNDFINILAADVIFTYFQDRLGMTHYLLIVGDNNTGKSNILLIFSLLGYRPVYDIAITPANIYNFGSQLEEAQHIIIEDEIDDIDQQSEKKKLYKQSYRSGTKVTRMYENSNSVNNKRKSSSRQQGFFLFSFKIFASEKMPDKKESKGFLERIIALKAVPGNPHYDISEVVDESGDEKFKELYDEVMNTRKLLLMYRLLHHTDIIPNVKLNIKNRYKQLTKPLIRLFQNTESVEDIKKSLSKYLIEKNQEKVDSLDFAILTLIINLVAKHGPTLYNDQIWQELKVQYPSGEIREKPYSWFVEGYGSISKTNITKICDTKFGAKQYKDREKGRGLIFKQEILNRLAENYSLIDGGIKIIKDKDDEESSSTKIKCDTLPTCDTFTEDTNSNSDINSIKDSSKTQESFNNGEEKTPGNDSLRLKTSGTIDKKTGAYSLELSQMSLLSPKPTVLKTPLQCTFSKIELGLFTNPLISESDLTQEDYDYDPEIINNIGRFERSDSWFCNNCILKGDKWFMMKHPCNTHKKRKGG
jgi:hypothetical protein